MAKADSLSGLELRIVNQLAAVEMKLNNPTTANNLLLESVKLSNAIYNTNKSAELNFLEARYQHEKRQKELSAMQAEVAAQKVEMIKKNRLLWIGALGVGAALLVLFLLFKANRSRLMLAKKDQLLKEEQIKFLERQQQVISLQSMINGQETERTRIAKDLHDGLGGLFSTVKMYLSTLKHEEQQLASKDLFTKSYDLVNNASQEVRRIAHNMMPEVLIKMGLVQAVQEMCDNVNAGKILQMQLLSYGMEKRLPVSMEMMLFRVLQELVNNIIKHSEATKAVIQFNKNGNQLTIIVEDNGKGFAGEREDAQSHIGLDTIKSRVDFLNGEFSIDSEKGIGTTAMLQFTLDEQSGEGTVREW